ncbi:D-amino acid oxidase [Elasticomyces elasticus]|uniref:D-amino acid oxidase n=1 Tax=Elasticomyces elasticus TaxID=574655 RepID=A0AAN7WGK1_9PEZI|nr:D-amino acid oxidase [Elasticomyces elasticus]
MAQKNIVVVGLKRSRAGVAGLTSAYLISQTRQYNITVVAKHMPGDYDIEYASPWAGANYMPVSLHDTKAAEWDRDTWYALEDLARNRPESGVHFQDDLPADLFGECEILSRDKDSQSATAEWFAELLSPSPWFKHVVPNFRILPTDKLGSGIQSGTIFTSVCINTAIYLPWLLSQCVKNGVMFKRANLGDITDAFDLGAQGKADLIVNCTGLGASKLGGVRDTAVVPARGQIVLVRNENGGKMVNLSGTDDGDQEACYVMTRAVGGGTILGGSYQKGDWNPEVDHELAHRIMQRAVKACPDLTGGSGKVEDLDVIRHGVGLRPVRDGGARVERECMSSGWVVHNYGHGGAGYQSSYGCAQGVVRLVKEVTSANPSRL